MRETFRSGDSFPLIRKNSIIRIPPCGTRYRLVTGYQPIVGIQFTTARLAAVGEPRVLLFL